MSEPTAATSAVPTPPEKPRRGVARFLLRTPLGLALCALALLAALVALAPSLGAGFAKGYASDWFAEHYQGRLAIQRLDLGWSGPQRIEGAELQDPDGVTVARIDATLPGLWAVLRSGGKRLGKLEVRGEASLARGADGRTNLDRALEPRAPAEEQPERGGSDSGSPSGLSELDVELEVRITRLSFEDERTRALGAPFVLQDLALDAKLKPGEPLSARVRGALSGSASGALSLDARVEHPFEPPSSATPPKAEIAGLVEHFPAALLDALARQEGRLEALLGDEVSLHLHAQGTVQEGTFELRVEAPRADVRASAQLAGGVLRSQEGGVTAELELAPGFLELALRPALPPGASLARLDPAAGGPAPRTSFSVPEFEAPVGAFLEASAQGRGDAALDVLLAGVRARWTSELGDWRYEDPAALAAAGPVTVRGLRFGGELKAPEETSSVELALEAAAGEAAPGTLRVALEFTGGASLARLTPASALAPAKVQVALKDVPAALFEPFAATRGDLARALGATFALDLRATVALEAEPSAAADWAGIGARWRELARRATADLALELAGSARGEPLEALGGQPFSVRTLTASAKLAPAADVELRARLDFEAPAAGNFQLDAQLTDAFAEPAAKRPLRFALSSKANGLPARAAGAVSGQGELPEQLLGKLLALEATAQGTLDDGIARVQLSGERSQIVLAGRLQGGAFVHQGEPALRMELQPDARLLDELAAPHLPPGTRLAFAEGRGVVGVDVGVLSLPVQELIDAAAKGGDVVATALAKTRCDATLTVRELDYEDEALRKAGRKVEKLALTVKLALKPEGRTAPLAVDVELASPSWPAGPIALHMDAPDAPALLGVAKGRTFAPITVRASGKELPTALLDAYAGGALAPALGPKLELALDARLAQAEGQPFTADAKLELGSGTARSKLAIAARVQDPFDPGEKRAPGVPPELEATLDVDGAGLLLAFAPEAARDPLRSLCGEKIAARVAVASSGPDALRADLTLDAGGLSAKGGLDYAGRVAKSVDKSPLELRVAPSQETLAKLLAGKLPEGASLELAEKGGALTVKIERLELPIGRYLDAEPAIAKAELLKSSTLGLTASLPAFVYTHPAEAGAPGTPVALRGVQAVAKLEPGKPATLDVTGDVQATPPGKLAIHVVAVEPAGLTTDPPAAGSSAKLDAQLSRFPSALLDVLARQDGLLVDVLGPELDAKVSGVYPDDGKEPLRAELHSALGDVALESRIQDGQIVSKGEQGLDAKIGVTPLFSKRIVGSLVPLLVEVRQDDPAQRSIITGRKLKLPMDGDLSKLSGDVVLDLGAVQYELMPVLSQALELGGAKGAKSAKLEPIEVKIKNGVARYDSLPLKIGGRQMEFRGSANLVDSTFELAFDVPLEMLGSKVESQLEKLRGVLDPKMKVPLELYGSWKSPRVRLGKGFLEKALKEAAQGELEKGLGGLLGGDKKKKKDG